MGNLVKRIMGRQLSKEEMQKAEEGTEKNLPLEVPEEQSKSKIEILYKEGENIIKKVGEYYRKINNKNFNSFRETSTYNSEGKLVEKESHLIFSLFGEERGTYEKVVYKRAGALIGKRVASQEYPVR